MKLFSYTALHLANNSYISGSSPKYVVLLGNAGTGKSTVVEKCTGERGRSSNAQQSYTAISECFSVPNGSLILCDTPATYELGSKFKNNMWIAHAMNFQPLSKILVTVKADQRIDNVIEAVQKFAERFLDVDPDLLGVLITHMDTVEWTEEKCRNHLHRVLDITDVVFSRKDTKGLNLTSKILQICNKTHIITINHQNFLKLFDVNEINMGIARRTQKEVDDMRLCVDSFYEEKRPLETSLKNRVDLIFEFQAWIKERIVEAQVKVSSEKGFTFYGEKAADEAGHIASMTNKMNIILRKLRTDALGYQVGQQADDLRKCPWCGLVWAKVEGCNGTTTCGLRPFQFVNNTLTTFNFKWDGKKLQIKKKGARLSVGNMSCHGSAVGCGKEINWVDMKPVDPEDPDVGHEFYKESKVNMTDVKPLTETSIPGWRDTFDEEFSKLRVSMPLNAIFKNPTDPILAELLKDQTLAELHSMLPLWKGKQSNIPEVQKLVAPTALMLRVDAPSTSSSGTGLALKVEGSPKPSCNFSMSTAFMADVDDTKVLMGAGHSFKPLKSGEILDNFKLIFGNLTGTTETNADTLSIGQLRKEYETTLVVRFNGMMITDNTTVENGLAEAVDFFCLILHKPKQTCSQETQTKLKSLGALPVAEGTALKPKAEELLLIIGHPNAAASNPQTPDAKPLRLDLGIEMPKTLPERFLYNMNTCGGNSGSPVIARGSPNHSYRVKGIHVQGFSKDDIKDDQFNRAQCLSSILGVIKPMIKKKVILVISI